MITLINFDNAETAKGVFYGGDAGAKNAVLYNDEAWMIKYPKTTRDLMNPQISYTTSPLSEYIGSQIYEALDIPVHKTLLGVRNNKVVVACKDFTRKWDDGSRWRMRGLWIEKILIPFHDLKNSFMTSDLESYSGTGSETTLSEVLATIVGQSELKSIPGVLERFWDMFVIDAFIGNNDRNNGNWGILIDQRTGEATLAPVFDNGNAFFNKRSISQMEKRMTDEVAMSDDAYKTPQCAFKYAGLDNEGHKINPFTFILDNENADCRAAVLRFTSAVDMKVIKEIIYSIPDAVGTLSVMPEIQKEFYLKLMDIRLEQVLLPYAKLATP
jgi:hypothetical protein